MQTIPARTPSAYAGQIKRSDRTHLAMTDDSALCFNAHDGAIEYGKGLTTTPFVGRLAERQLDAMDGYLCIFQIESWCRSVKQSSYPVVCWVLLYSCFDIVENQQVLFPVGGHWLLHDDRVICVAYLQIISSQLNIVCQLPATYDYWKHCHKVTRSHGAVVR